MANGCHRKENTCSGSICSIVMSNGRPSYGFWALAISALTAVGTDDATEVPNTVESDSATAQVNNRPKSGGTVENQEPLERRLPAKLPAPPVADHRTGFVHSCSPISRDAVIFISTWRAPLILVSSSSGELMAAARRLDRRVRPFATALPISAWPIPEIAALDIGEIQIDQTRRQNNLADALHGLAQNVVRDA
jgi:hypothetical protein